MAKIFRQTIRQNIYLQNKYSKTLIFRVFGRLERPNNPKIFSQLHHDRFVRLRVNYLVIIINFILNVKAKMRWFVK